MQVCFMLKGMAFLIHEYLYFQLQENKAKHSHIKWALEEFQSNRVNWNIAWSLLDTAEQFLPHFLCINISRIRKTLRMNREKWQQDIFSGVKRIPAEGVGGNIVLTEETAHAMLAPSVGHGVFIAAAEYGHGRIIVFSHHAYARKLYYGSDVRYRRFAQNVRNWVSKDRYANRPDEIVMISRDWINIAYNTTILVVDTGNNEIDKVLSNWVRNGGGLIYCVTPWGVKNLNILPSSLAKAGIVFTSSWHKQIGSYEVKTTEDANAHLAKNIHNALHRNISDVPALFDGHKMIDIPHMVLMRLNAKIQRIFFIYTELIKSRRCPTRFRPIRISDRSVLQIYRTYSVMAEYSINRNLRSPCISNFPGEIENNYKQLRVHLRISAPIPDLYSTGYYLKAGNTMHIKVTSSITCHTHDWSIIIGSHTDDLTSLKHWKRMPKISIRQRLRSSFIVTSPFGGLVYLELESSCGQASSIDIVLDNVFQSPYFDVTSRKSVSSWATRRYADGPWAEIAGEFVTITLPSSAIRALMNPGPVMRMWDRLWIEYNNLRGTNIRHHKRQRIVADVQPFNGYMHAGYPIVTHLDIADPNASCFVLNTTHLQLHGLWALFHELGHNLQNDKWTTSGQREVTVNIFTVFGLDVTTKHGYIHFLSNHIASVRHYLEGSIHDISTLNKDPFAALSIYVQLAESFGWDSYRKFFRAYENSKLVVTDDQNKTDTIFTLFSRTVNRNLAPMFIFWGIRFSVAAYREVASLQHFLPDDRFTALAPSRVKELQGRFPNITRTPNKTRFWYNKTMQRPIMRQPYSNIISENNMNDGIK